MRRVLTLVLCLLSVPCTIVLSRQSSMDAATADSIRREFLHAWNGYHRFAWGHDALDPLSQQPRDWYGTSLCMTPVDAFDTMVLMGLTREAAEAKQLILDSLRFDRNIEVQGFEVTIRLVGGLLSAYQMDGDKRFLDLATDLANRLLPLYHSPTGMPWRFVNLRTGAVRDSVNNPAEIGTSLLEFGLLSRLTGDSTYIRRAKHAVLELFRRRSPIGLVGTSINILTGEWVDRSSHIGGMIDSYYEYLLKASILLNDSECRQMWDQSRTAIETYVADTAHGSLWYGVVDMDTGRRLRTVFGSLEAFYPAVLCLAGDTTRAERLEASCLRMWNAYGIEPEEFDYTTMTAISPQYYLRPEIIESAYYLYHVTGDEKYREMGRIFFDAIRRYCRTDAGYAMLKSVITKERGDRMESFFFAETLKYLYLLFADPQTLPFGQVVFNTEAHPLRPAP